MGDRLAFRIEAPAGTLELPFPPASIQPLVKNAISHGLETRLGGRKISATVTQTGNALRVVEAETTPICPTFGIDWNRPDLSGCAEVADGDAALTAIAQHRPDIVSLDFRLPGPSGIKECKKNVRIILSVGFGGPAPSFFRHGRHVTGIADGRQSHRLPPPP